MLKHGQTASYSSLCPGVVLAIVVCALVLGCEVDSSRQCTNLVGHTGEYGAAVIHW